jgi:hypothetical protein
MSFRFERSNILSIVSPFLQCFSFSHILLPHLYMSRQTVAEQWLNLHRSRGSLRLTSGTQIRQPRRPRSGTSGLHSPSSRQQHRRHIVSPHRHHQTCRTVITVANVPQQEVNSPFTPAKFHHNQLHFTTSGPNPHPTRSLHISHRSKT